MTRINRKPLIIAAIAQLVTFCLGATFDWNQRSGIRWFEWSGIILGGAVAIIILLRVADSVRSNLWIGLVVMLMVTQAGMVLNKQLGGNHDWIEWVAIFVGSLVFYGVALWLDRLRPPHGDDAMRSLRRTLEP